MRNSPITLSGALSALVIAGAMAAFLAQPATAQSAKNLKCNGCVNSRDVKNNNLKATDLRDEAGMDFSSTTQSTAMATNVDTIFESVTISAPRTGLVMVNASGYFGFDNSGGQLSCSITTGSTVETSNEFTTEGDASSNLIAFGATRGFDVVAGTTTFNLVCRETTPNASVRTTNMTALYVPTRY